MDGYSCQKSIKKNITEWIKTIQYRDERLN